MDNKNLRYCVSFVETEHGSVLNFGVLNSRYYNSLEQAYNSLQKDFNNVKTEHPNGNAFLNEQSYSGYVCEEDGGYNFEWSCGPVEPFEE